MELTEDEIIQKYGKRGGHCNRILYFLKKTNLLAFHVVTT